MNEKKLFDLLFEIRDEVKNTVKRQEFDEFKDRIFRTLDEHKGVLIRLEQEQMATRQGMKRHEKNIEENKKEITHIKKVLKSV